MKQIISFIFIVAAFCSCQKKQCYQCIHITNFGGNTKPQIDYSSHCGWTETDKLNYVQSQSIVSSKYSVRVSCTVH